MVAFWDGAPRILTVCRRFRTHCLHLKDWRFRHIWISTSPNVVTAAASIQLGGRLVIEPPNTKWMSLVEYVGRVWIRQGSRSYWFKVIPQEGSWLGWRATRQFIQRGSGAFRHGGYVLIPLSSQDSVTTQQPSAEQQRQVKISRTKDIICSPWQTSRRISFPATGNLTIDGNYAIVQKLDMNIYCVNFNCWCQMNIQWN